MVPIFPSMGEFVCSSIGFTWISLAWSITAIVNECIPILRLTVSCAREQH